MDGITAPGSEAVAEVASSAEDLRPALGKADWTQKNVQIVVKTPVTDGTPAPHRLSQSMAGEMLLTCASANGAATLKGRIQFNWLARIQAIAP